MIPRRLNPQAMAIEDAQTQIRILIKDGVRNGISQKRLMMQVAAVIEAARKAMINARLKAVIPTALSVFAYNAYSLVVVSLGDAFGGKLEAAERVTRSGRITWEETAKGIPTQRYAKTYIADVKRIMDALAYREALDPDDISGRNSLRNKAEMEVRYQFQQDRISELKDKGIRLVVASVHADCSDRCYPWQGRVYSLDGTSGTIDGFDYVPLETATGIVYTTKSGRKYNNGLLGFNCRHYLREYQSGMGTPYVTRATQQREYKINLKQRQYENRIRQEREKALMAKDIDRDKYLAARAKAIKLNKEYIKFSRDNDRAYYPDRVKVLN